MNFVEFLFVSSTNLYVCCMFVVGGRCERYGKIH
jgi:hypothetical protein